MSTYSFAALLLAATIGAGAVPEFGGAASEPQVVAHELWIVWDDGTPPTSIGKGDGLLVKNTDTVAWDFDLYKPMSTVPYASLTVPAGTSVEHYFAVGTDRVTTKSRVQDNVQNEEIDSLCGLDCLPAGTPILTTNGLVPVERARAGWGLWGGEAGDLGIAEVESALAAELVELRVGEETLRTSVGHMFLTADGNWIEARELQPGARIATRDGGSCASILAARTVRLEEPVLVYDVRVEGGGRLLIGSAGLVTRANAAEPASRPALSTLQN